LLFAKSNYNNFLLWASIQIEQLPVKPVFEIGAGFRVPAGVKLILCKQLQEFARSYLYVGTITRVVIKYTPFLQRDIIKILHHRAVAFLLRKPEKFSGFGCRHVHGLLPECRPGQVNAQVPGGQVFDAHTPRIP